MGTIISNNLLVTLRTIAVTMPCTKEVSITEEILAIVIGLYERDNFELGWIVWNASQHIL